ncbi:hypothetical protein MCNS_47120 [Mycobacterium conspicuum]|uniref:Uncharacterized protein n=1 Tax=Mycobacterium conspicuum TaxID=44010 RepID=A0A7I7YJ31_9MYCO|nr:hypothetical protein MCNS_47120 [Mycobacterium conspicuum]
MPPQGTAPAGIPETAAVEAARLSSLPQAARTPLDTAKVVITDTTAADVLPTLRLT